MMRNKAGRLRGVAPTQVDYHWLWGLWVNRQASSPTRFGLEVERLLGDKEALGQIKEQQERVARRPFVVRFFYWLFNVDNYAYHSHVLGACEAFKSTPNREASVRDDRRAAGSVGQGNSPRARLGVGEDSRGSQTPPVGQEEVPSSFGGGEIPVTGSMAQEGPSVAAAKSLPDVRVTLSMVAPLSVLGMNKAVGDVLSLEEFKKAVKKKRLSTHPDKGGVGDAFTEVTRAIEDLEGIFSKEGTPKRAGTYKSFYEAVAELRAEMAAARAADRLEAARLRAADRVEIEERFSRMMDERLARLEGRTGGGAPSAAGGLSTHGVFGARGGGRGAGVGLTPPAASVSAGSGGFCGWWW